MQTSDPLTLYRKIRDSIDDIHHVAAVIETELARVQIYREQEAIARALDRVHELSEEIAALESDFRLCADSMPKGRTDAMVATVQTASLPLL